MIDDPRSEADDWATTVTEIMQIFRDGLLALIPVAERARIGWRDQTYDDWDKIAGALFECIVSDSITNARSLSVSQMVNLAIPRYSLLYEDYSAMSFIETVVGGRPGPPYLVFHSFATTRAAFDTVRWCRIDEQGRVIGEHFEEARFEQCEFLFQHRLTTSELKTIRELVVSL